MQIVYTNFPISSILAIRTIITSWATGPHAPPANTSPKPFHLINLICYDPRKAHFMNNYSTFNKNVLLPALILLFYFLDIYSPLLQFFFHCARSCCCCSEHWEYWKLTRLVCVQLESFLSNTAIVLIINFFGLLPSPVFHLTQISSFILFAE